jgi:SAM-dependent methyltransferase
MATPSLGGGCIWNLEQTTDPIFRNKFENCVRIFREWLSPVRPLAGTTILEFGCGDGIMGLGMSLQLEPARVIGVEITPDFQGLAAEASRQIGLSHLPSNLELHLVDPNERLAGKFEADVVFSWSVFEHVSQEYLDDVVADLHGCLRPGGHAFIQIAPLYYSANGGHLYGLVDEPWGHLRRQSNWLQSMVLNARPPLGHHEPGGAEFRKRKESVWSCYLTLNRITADDLLELFQRHDFELLREYRSQCEALPPASLLRVYNERVLRTEQIVGLFRKR